MSAPGGRRLYVSVNGQPGSGRSTSTGGSLLRKGGWIYGSDDRNEWAIPESAVVKIEEA
jgi:hypothetical protein